MSACILHITAGYPDPLAGETTAVRNLLAATPGHEHRVYSFKRVGWRAGIHMIPFDDACGLDHRAIAWGAPPRGILMATRLDRLAAWIGDDVEARGLKPDVVHAHKLSVEGLVGERLAARFGVPLMVSAQGDSDLKILRARPDLRPRWRRIWRGAAVAFPFAPWTAAKLDALLGRRDGPTALLPCPFDAQESLAPRIAGPVFRSAFHMRYARRKNGDGLIRAVALAARRIPDIRLEILGGGDPGGFAWLDGLARRAAPGRVRFLGAVPNAQVQDLFNASCAFALPSRRESFGMVYAEALLAGAPCLLSRGWGFDGYLPDGEATVSTATDPAAIAEGLERLARDEAAFKARLAALAASGGLDFLRRESIAATYRNAVGAVLSAARGDAILMDQSQRAGYELARSAIDPLLNADLPRTR